MESLPIGVPPHFVVFVPGYLGSRLRDKTTDQIVWGDFSSIPANPLKWRGWLDNLVNTLKYPNENLEPAGILDELLFIPPWAKQEHYGRMLEALEDMGYQVDESLPEQERNVYTFAYDWRQDNRISGRELGEAIERWRTFHPGAKVWIIAHSNGGVVSRWYIEKEGGKAHVERLFLMGSPWDGTPKAMALLFSGLETMIWRRLNVFNVSERTREMFRTFPSIYQLLPLADPFVRGLNNEVVSPYDDPNWLSSHRERQFVADAKRFNEELGTTPSVETLCFFGRKQLTTTFGLVSFAARGRWKAIEWKATEAGDGTIPTRSAVNSRAAENLPFAVGHGDIYVNSAVLEILEWELIDKHGQPDRASLITQRLTILFEPNQDIYSPNEEINLWATIHENKEPALPVSGANVTVELLWRAALPGSESVKPPKDLASTRLWEREKIKGRYENSDEERLMAPDTEGYYQLRATVEVIGEPALQLEELILVETLPLNVQE